MSEVIMRFLSAVLLLLLAFTVSPVWARCEDRPQDVQDFLRTEAGWSIINVDDLVEEERDAWKRYRGGGLCPGMAEGNFFGDNKQAYALALKKTIDGHLFEKLVVISRIGERLIATEVVPQEDAMRTGGILVVWRIVPGTYKDLDSDTSIGIKTDPIVFELIGSTSTIYYYSEGAFKSLRITE